MISAEKQTSIQSYRLRQISYWLNKRDYGAIILFDPVNIRYATGSRNMQVWTMHNFCRYAVVLPNNKVVMFELSSSMHLSKDLEAITEFRPAITADYMAVADRTREMATKWAKEIHELLVEHGVVDELIAIDRADLELVLASQQENIQLVDGKSIMERARSVKSLEEIEALTISLRTCEASVMDMKNYIEPGHKESEAMGLMIKGSVDRGGEYPETRLLSSGPRTNPWFQETSDRVIENGDMMAFDTDMIGPMGFYNDISRSWIVGDKKATETQKYLYRLAHEQLQHNMALLKPGIGFLEYSDQSYQLPEECIPNRYADVAHGCGLGVEYPFIWYREDEQWGAYDGIFEENMVVCIECYAGQLNGEEGVKLEQPIWITEHGPKLLSEFPLEEEYLG